MSRKLVLPILLATAALLGTTLAARAFACDMTGGGSLAARDFESYLSGGGYKDHQAGRQAVKDWASASGQDADQAYDRMTTLFRDAESNGNLGQLSGLRDGLDENRRSLENRNRDLFGFWTNQVQGAIDQIDGVRLKGLERQAGIDGLAANARAQFGNDPTLWKDDAPPWLYAWTFGWAFGDNRQRSVTLGREEQAFTFALHRTKLNDLAGQIVLWNGYLPGTGEVPEGTIVGAWRDGTLDQFIEDQVAAATANAPGSTRYSGAFTVHGRDKADPAFQADRASLTANLAQQASTINDYVQAIPAAEADVEAAQRDVDLMERRRTAVLQTPDFETKVPFDRRLADATKALADAQERLAEAKRRKADLESRKSALFQASPILGIKVGRWDFGRDDRRPLWQFLVDHPDAADAVDFAVGEHINNLEGQFVEVAGIRTWDAAANVLFDPANAPLHQATGFFWNSVFGVSASPYEPGGARGHDWSKLIQGIYVSHQQDIRLDQQGTDLTFMAAGTGLVILTGGTYGIAWAATPLGYASPLWASIALAGIAVTDIGVSTYEYWNADERVKAAKANLDQILATGGDPTAAQTALDKAISNARWATFGAGMSMLGVTDIIDGGSKALRLWAGLPADAADAAGAVRRLDDAFDPSITRSGETAARAASPQLTSSEGMTRWMDNVWNNPPPLTYPGAPYADPAALHAWDSISLYHGYYYTSPLTRLTVDPTAVSGSIKSSVADANRALQASGSNLELRGFADEAFEHGEGYYRLYQWDAATRVRVDGTERIYFHVDPNHAATFMNSLTQNLHRFPGCTQIKMWGVNDIAGVGRAHGRSDAIVGYCTDAATADALADFGKAYSDQNPGHFLSETPLGTDPRSYGVARGSEPTAGGKQAIAGAFSEVTGIPESAFALYLRDSSFGGIRGHAIYLGLLETRKAGGNRTDFTNWVNRFLTRFQVDPANPSRNLSAGAAAGAQQASTVGQSARTTGEGAQAAAEQGAAAGQSAKTADPNATTVADDRASADNIPAFDPDRRQVLDRAAAAAGRRTTGQVLRLPGRFQKEDPTTAPAGAAGAAAGGRGMRSTRPTAGGTEPGSGGDTGQPDDFAAEGRFVLYLFGKSDDQDAVKPGPIRDEKGSAIGVVSGPPVKIGSDQAVPIQTTPENAPSVEDAVSKKTGAKVLVSPEKTREWQAR